MMSTEKQHTNRSRFGRVAHSDSAVDSAKAVDVKAMRRGVNTEMVRAIHVW